MDFQTFPTLVLWQTDPELFPRDPHLLGCSCFRGTPPPSVQWDAAKVTGWPSWDHVVDVGPCVTLPPAATS